MYVLTLIMLIVGQSPPAPLVVSDYSSKERCESVLKYHQERFDQSLRALQLQGTSFGACSVK